MKTLTEFFGPKLATAQGKMASWKAAATAAATEALTAEGKSAEDIAAALPGAVPVKILETLAIEEKLEGDKGKWFLKALELVEGKRGNLKRVIVGQLAEGEKAPSGATTDEDKAFILEFYPEASRAQRSGKSDGRDERGGRGGKGKGRGGKDRGERGRGDRNDRGGRGGPRGERPVGEGSSEGRSFAPRKPREPRAPREIPPPRPGIIKPRSEVTAAAATPAPTSDTPSSN